MDASSRTNRLMDNVTSLMRQLFPLVAGTRPEKDYRWSISIKWDYNEPPRYVVERDGEVAAVCCCVDAALERLIGILEECISEAIKRFS